MMKEKNIQWIWFGVNLAWWSISIGMDLCCRVDVNPLLGNTGEVVVNLLLWLIGHVVIDSLKN